MQKLKIAFTAIDGSNGSIGSYESTHFIAWPRVGKSAEIDDEISTKHAPYFRDKLSFSSARELGLDFCLLVGAGGPD